MVNDMKVLVFGNNSGIDGLGGVILASLAFENQVN